MRALLFLLLLPLSALAADDAPWQPLYGLVDKTLQAELDGAVRANATWRTLARGRKLGICVVDLSTTPPRFARVNGNVMMYAASLPKIAILLGAYVAIDEGRLALTPELEADLDAMIRVSSNAAATRVLDRVGMKALHATLRDPKYGLYDPKRGGGLWVGKRYGKSGGRIGDPIHGISHGATPTQVCRFYYQLAKGQLIGPERSEQMLDHLADPKLHHKFVKVLDQRAPGARVFRKSGTWRDFHSDSVLVRGQQWRNYILVGIAQAANGGQVLAAVLPRVEQLIRPASESTSCAARRNNTCADIDQPVCATRDNGVRCVTTPCDSVETATYPNDCAACADQRVISYVRGECPDADEQ